MVNKSQLFYKSYNNESIVYERNFLSISGGSSESSPFNRLVGIPYAELGSSNPGSEGIVNNHRLSNRIPQETILRQTPNNPSLSSNKQELIEMEVESMLSKGAVTKLQPSKS